MASSTHPLSGAVSNCYFSNDDGTVEVAALCPEKSMFADIKKDIEEHKWNEADFLLATFPKNGTHFMWEIMTMLLRGSENYITDPKVACMIDLFPLKKCDEVFPSPRVLNTHYRLDVLPKEFRGKKTVLVIRNPKDTSVSAYYHDTKVMGGFPQMQEFIAGHTYSKSVKMFLHGKDLPYGNYFDYIEYMWSLKDDPNFLTIYFEDLVTDPVSSIQKVNEFMGTNRSQELIEKIAEATRFNKMKEGKATNYAPKAQLEKQFDRIKQARGSTEERKLDDVQSKIYRKGEIGDWKNHLTVAENEMFDEFLERWPLSREIPFKY